MGWLYCPGIRDSLTYKLFAGIVWEPVAEKKELTRNSSVKTRPQSSQLVEPLWIDPGLESGIGGREMIPTLGRKKKKKKKKEARAENELSSGSPPPPILARGKSHHHHHHHL